MGPEVIYRNIMVLTHDRYHLGTANTTTHQIDEVIDTQSGIGVRFTDKQVRDSSK
jgi:hypothetical protein